MADLSTGADSVGGERFGNCEYNDIKNHWRMSDPCANLSDLQPGMIVSNEDDDRLYVVSLVSGCDCSEIVQACVPLSSDKYIGFGDNREADIGYDTAHCALLLGIPVSALDSGSCERGLIIMDEANLAAGDDVTGLVPPSMAEPSVFIVDSDLDSYLGIGLQVDDRPGIWSGPSDAIPLAIQYEATADVTFFEASGSGETRELLIYGFRAADALRSLQIGVGVDAADCASFDGVSNFYFDGNVGIGIVPPSRQVQINQAAGGELALTRTTGDVGSIMGRVTFGNVSVDDILAEVQGVQDGATDAGALTFWTEPVGAGLLERMKIDSTGIIHWERVGDIKQWTYQGDLADDGTFNLPAITDSCWGFIQAGNNEEYALFTVDDDGDVTLISNSANVVANADTDGKLCIGTAGTQEPLVIRNRLAAEKNINLIIWYS